MKIYSFLIVFLVGCFFSLQAQTSAGAAKKLLNEASSEMNSYDNLYIEFDYNFKNPRVNPPVTQEESGKIAIKGNNYHLNFMGTEQLRDGNKLYTILRQDKEVQVTTYKKGEESGLTPSKIMDLYREGYSYKLGGSEKKDGKLIKYVILEPNSSEDIDKIMVGIENNSKKVHSLQQWGTNGTITTFKLTKLVPNKDFPEGHFSFNQADYSDYYIMK